MTQRRRRRRRADDDDPGTARERMAARLNHDNILLLEQPLIKVPSDSLRTSFRSTQRTLDGGLTPLRGNLTDLQKRAEAWAKSGDGNAREEALKSIETMLTKARGAKRKIEEARSHPQVGSEANISRIEQRLAHLQDLHDAEMPTDEKYRTFSRIRLDRQLADHMLRCGYTRSADALSKASGIEKLVDNPLFAEVDRIEKALRGHSCTEALAWCKENASGIKKLESTLEFELRYQEYVELARARRLREAIAYCQEKLVPWHDTQLEAIKKATALLAFDARTSCPPYAALYDSSRWDRLLSSFRSTVFSLHAIPSQSVLQLSLSVGLASLKLPACYGARRAMTDKRTSSEKARDDEDEDMADESESEPSDDDDLGDEQEMMMSASLATLPPKRTKMVAGGPAAVLNPDCPTCDRYGLGKLAKECPWSHHVNSTIVCGITGKVVEDGELAALPNGRVYSRQGLEAMAIKSEGKVTCPRTGQVFEIVEARRLYIS